jgi:hypothetical protein
MRNDRVYGDPKYSRREYITKSSLPTTVKPVCLDEKHSEWGYFIVAVDNPYSVAKNQKGHDQG